MHLLSMVAWVLAAADGESNSDGLEIEDLNTLRSIYATSDFRVPMISKSDSNLKPYSFRITQVGKIILGDTNVFNCFPTFLLF